MLTAEIAGPVDLFQLHRRWPERYPFLLQSVAAHPQSARYDLLFGGIGGALELRDGSLKCTGDAPPGSDFFSALSAWARAEATPDNGNLPYCGGWFVFLGYEAAAIIEPRLRLPRSPHKLPDALAVRCTTAAIHDRERGVTRLLSERDPAGLECLRDDLLRVDRATAARAEPLVHAIEEDPPEHFLRGVGAILQYLGAGDVFQINLSRGWRASLRAGVGYGEIYERLRQANPAPFAGLLCWNGAAVLSSSPERLVQVQGRDVQTRPIAGTHPRGRDLVEDQALLARLLSSVKERAEHIMLIDLERNDLGRVCATGSVTVSELMRTESYAHVHHIVSNVTGRLRPEAGPGEVLRAVFPGGTITGCPKVRAMEIIAELEGEGRGPYTGAMGYLSRDGRMDMNILIRSLVCEGDRLSLRAGAGIVADSQAQAELAETRSKARGLLLALGEPG